jgi:phosphatidylethanolamine/phosphatidyl-N-methylethanolamine N-methyltransferase
VEYDRDFAELLKQRFQRAHIIKGDALDLDRTLGRFRDMTFSAVMSGVPLLTLSRQSGFATSRTRLIARLRAGT